MFADLLRGQHEPKAILTVEEAILRSLGTLLASDFSQFLRLVTAVRTGTELEGWFGEYGARFVQHVGGGRTYVYTVRPEVAAVVKKYVKGDGVDMKVDMPTPAPAKAEEAPAKAE